MTVYDSRECPGLALNREPQGARKKVVADPVPRGGTRMPARTEPPRSGHGLVAALLVAATIFLGSCGGGEPSTRPVQKSETVPEKPGPQQGAAAVSETETAPLSVAVLPDLVARVEALRQRALRALAPDVAERYASSALGNVLAGIVETKPGGTVPFDEFVEKTRRIVAAERQVIPIGEAVTDRLRAVEKWQREASDLQEELQAHARLLEEGATPPELQERVRRCQDDLAELGTRLAGRRREILVDLSRLADVRGRLASLEAENEAQILEARERVAEQSGEPIWRLHLTGREAIAITADRIGREASRVSNYAKVNAGWLALVAATVLGSLVTLLKKLRPGAARRAATDPDEAAALRIMESPWVASIPFTVLALILLAPPAPSVVYQLAWIPAAPTAAWIVVKILGPAESNSIWVLAASLALFPFRNTLDLSLLTERITLILQTAPLALVLARDLLRGQRWSGRLANGTRSRLLAIAAWFLVGALGIAAAGSIGGWVTLASFISTAALSTLGGAILIMASYLVLVELLKALIASAPAQALRMVRLYPHTVTATGVKVLRLLAIGTGMFIGFSAFEVATPAGRALLGLFDAKLTLGSVSLSAGSIIAFTAILALASFLSRIVSFVLAEEFLPHLSLKRGVAFSIAVTARYLVLLLGFVFAAGAAGLDLTKMGFFAGALGVGIGFGLQNVVSNFISGLILLSERPVQIGDAIEVSGTTGQVTRIGIRSSTVSTFDGAEVVVPNSDLISKPVTNWTLSNPNRRFDVPVGVAYGSPLEATAQSLLAAARRTEGVVPEPAPEAFFESFGDSALVWRIRLWARMEDSPRVLSALKRAVAEELEKAQIEVPFPQLDIHVRTLAK